MTTALEKLYNDLQNGKRYGTYHADYPYPCFSAVLYLEEDWRGKQWIHWRNYGQSSEENTLEGLELALKIIFRMSAKEFLGHYHTEDEYEWIDRVVDEGLKTSHRSTYPKYPRWNFFCKGKDGYLHFKQVEADSKETAYGIAVGQLREEAGCEPDTYGLFKAKN